MMKEGPIPLFAHGMIEYAAGVLLVVAPFLLSFDSGAATAVSIALGVLIIAVAASTDGPTSLVNQLPRPAHVALDYVLVALLIAMPFLAGFSDETPPTALFIALGVVHLLITIGTRFRSAGEGTSAGGAPARARKRSRRRRAEAEEPSAEPPAPAS
jgi:hypothetical protein